jgi:uroporphyrin-III C-methyltransferase
MGALLHKQPRLTVVGAGPGDPDLITLKGINALRCADVVLYDALIGRELLDYVPKCALQIFVGKRREKKAFEQAEINEMIVEYARHCGHVVRLKGGDPFVFGRGLEEMQHAQNQGLVVEYIPGISSAVAAPAAAGIAVTGRGASRGFWTLTATTAAGALNPDIRFAAQTDACIVILMGLSKLPEIAAEFADAGKPDMPIAVIQDATLPEQKAVFGRIADIEAQVREHGIGSPAVLVIGEAVRHRLVFGGSFQVPLEMDELLSFQKSG